MVNFVASNFEQRDPIHINHIISGLQVGGAERTLEQLVLRLEGEGFRNTVGYIGQRLQKFGLLAILP